MRVWASPRSWPDISHSGPDPCLRAWHSEPRESPVTGYRTRIYLFKRNRGLCQHGAWGPTCRTFGRSPRCRPVAGQDAEASHFTPAYAPPQTTPKSQAELRSGGDGAADCYAVWNGIGSAGGGNRAGSDATHPRTSDAPIVLGLQTPTGGLSSFLRPARISRALNTETTVLVDAQ